MGRYEAGTTNPVLLDRLGDWRDREAWVDFFTRYDPLIRSACGRFGLDAEATEDLCQRVWIELARRMRAFRYDPGRKFRGWLRRLCRSRAIDWLRRKKDGAIESLDDQPAEALRRIADEELGESEESERPILLRLAEEVQEAVRRRCDERTWQLFWKIAVEGQSVRDAAEAAGISYFAAFAAQKRVRRMLREEGQRFMVERGDEPESDEAEID